MKQISADCLNMTPFIFYSLSTESSRDQTVAAAW